MPWTVRTADGSLDFASLADVERAFRNGLVDPEDELREGDGKWIAAGSHAALRSTRMQMRSNRSAAAMPVLLAVGLAIVALVLLAVGQWVLGIAVALVVSLYSMRFARRFARPAFARA